MKLKYPGWENNNCCICILENPASGPGGHTESVAQLAQLLTDDGCRVHREQLTSIEQTREQITAYLNIGCDLIVAAGGDGTVRSISQCINGSNIPIYIFPVGTENLLAKELGLSRDPHEAFETIRQWNIRNIDEVRINDKIFLAVGGVGIDSQVVAMLDKSRKGNIKKIDYVWPTFRTFFTYKFPIIKIIADGRNICNEPAILFLGNISRYGGGFRLFDNALCDDGKVDLVVFRCKNVLQLIYLFMLTILGIVEKSKMTSRYKCSKINIESEHHLRSQIDGDTGPYLPLDIQVQKGALPLLVLPDVSKVAEGNQGSS
ncbi:MAG: NAD(+)/NADH kinase [Anaerohalosphaera sp.]|nr:NAD(+)/NADH kinase [Anaerohalosphaera sp.]